MKLARLTVVFLLAPGWPAAAQVFDNTGNSLLNGTYYFREVIYNLNQSLSAAVYGNIKFDGAGSYQIFGAMEVDSNSGFPQPYSSTGTYTISASGFGFFSNQLLGNVTYGAISNGIFIGSSTESGYNDLFIATPVNAQNAGTLQGSYSLAYIHPLVPFDALLQMSPNGAGTVGTVSVTAYQASTTPITQSIAGVKYSVSNNAFVLTFPNSQTNAITGQEYLYSSPDGSFVFGGSPGDVDMFVGIRSGSQGTNFGGALYYQAGLDEDVTQLANGSVGFDTFYGSFNATSGIIVGHQRVFANSVVYGYTYGDTYPQNTSGDYTDNFISSRFFGGSGGTVRIGLGIGPFLAISVAVAAPNFSGSGVYLNPTGVVNAASSSPFTAGVAPGELITLVGTNIGPNTLQVASTIPFPSKLGGVQVLINNVPAPIYYVSQNQVSAIVPYQTSGVAQIQVVNNGAASNAVTEFVVTTAPGVFTQPAGGVGYAAALHPDFSLVTPSSPAKIGETVAVFVTGLGAVFPSIPDGSAGPSPNFSNATNPIAATVGGQTATVAFAGLAPGLAGLYQVNVQIPSGVASGDSLLSISGPDSFSSEALISISPAASGQAEPARAFVPQRRNLPRIPFQTRRILLPTP